MTRTVTVYVAVVPWDYATAHVEVFENKPDAEAFIREWDTRKERQGFILERPIVCE